MFEIRFRVMAGLHCRMVGHSKGWRGLILPWLGGTQDIGSVAISGMECYWCSGAPLVRVVEWWGWLTYRPEGNDDFAA